jgi:quinol monooxygenase YgiN
MPTIEPATTVVTHINVFTVDPARQQALVDSLIETVEEARNVPGCISASIH